MRRNQARSSSEWRQIVSEFHSSGETQKAFAPRHGVTAAALQYWILKLRKEGASAKRKTFVEVAVAPKAAQIELELGHGRALRFETGTDVAYVTRLADSIIASASC